MKLASICVFFLLFTELPLLANDDNDDDVEFSYETLTDSSATPTPEKKREKRERSNPHVARSLSFVESEVVLPTLRDLERNGRKRKRDYEDLGLLYNLPRPPQPEPEAIAETEMEDSEAEDMETDSEYESDTESESENSLSTLEIFYLVEVRATVFSHEFVAAAISGAINYLIKKGNSYKSSCASCTRNGF